MKTFVIFNSFLLLILTIFGVSNVIAQDGFKVIQIDPYYTAKNEKYHAPIEFFLTPTQEQPKALPYDLRNKILEIYRFNQIDGSLSGQEVFEQQRQNKRRELAKNIRAERKRADAIRRMEYRKRAELSQKKVIVNRSELSEDEDEIASAEEAEFCGTRNNACCGGEYCEEGLSCQKNQCQLTPPPCGEFEESCCAQAQTSACSPDLSCINQKCVLSPLPPKQSKKKIAQVKIVDVYDSVVKAILIEDQEQSKDQNKKSRSRARQYSEAIMLDDIGILAQ